MCASEESLLWLLKVQQSGPWLIDCSEMKGIHVSFKLTALYIVHIEYYMINALENEFGYMCHVRSTA